MIDEKNVYFFGRNKDQCDFVIDHASCSRVHAVLLWHKHLNRSFLIDLDSSKWLKMIPDRKKRVKVFYDKNNDLKKRTERLLDRFAWSRTSRNRCSPIPSSNSAPRLEVISYVRSPRRTRTFRLFWTRRVTLPRIVPWVRPTIMMPRWTWAHRICPNLKPN